MANSKLDLLASLLPQQKDDSQSVAMSPLKPKSPLEDLFSEQELADLVAKNPAQTLVVQPKPALITQALPAVELDSEIKAQALQAVDNEGLVRQPASEAPQAVETQEKPLNEVKQVAENKPVTPESSGYYDTLKAALSAMSGAQAMSSGVARKPDLSILDDLRDAPKRTAQQKALEQGLESKQFELQTEKEKSDPDSLISQVYRSAAQKLGIQVPEKATARALEAIIGKNVMGNQVQGKLIRMGTTPDGRPVAMNTATGEYQIGDVTLADSAFTSKDPQTGETLVLGRRGGGLIKKIGAAEQTTPEQKEVTYKNLNPKQKEVLNKAQEQVKKDDIVAGGREALVAADNAILLLNQGKAQGQDIVRAIQNMLSRATGERGVMTEADVAPFGGSAAVLDRLQRYGTVALKGKLPEEDRKFLSEFATALRSAAQSRVSSGAAPFIKELSDKVEVTPENAAKLLSIEELSNKKSSANEMGGPASTVKIKDTKSGKVKIFAKDKADEILKKDKDDKLNRFILVD